MTNKQKILIVDDEADLRELISSEFELNGFDTVEAENGTIALSIVKEQKIDAIVSDIRMPGGDGITLIKKLNELPNPPLLVFITGFADITPEEALALGAKAIFSKPFDLAAIVDAIQGALNK